MERRILVFTRYPEPWKTKTRLIPALGAAGAADLQREMTRHTLAVLEALPAELAATWEVWFEGGTAEKMAVCFGEEAEYYPQCPGDLGARMHHAFSRAFSEGARRVLLVGTDCPEITAELLAEAYKRLEASDLVLGPARDGGYYLIGLRRPVPELFCDIPWGGDRVLAETRSRAERLALGVFLLRTLGDVDRPEDLPAWHRVKHGERGSSAQISIIIPAIDEADCLPDTLASLRDADRVETLVVDGGSHDATPQIAERGGCRLLRSPPGRALQMNHGAQAACGSILLFLHADTRLPPAFFSSVLETLDRPGVMAGAFQLTIESAGWTYRILERAVSFRSRRFQMPYGDQGIFVPKETFHELGGYADLPIMEDFEFVRRVRRRGRIGISPLAVSTSARRWQQRGPWRTTWINQKIVAGYTLGVSAERLAAWYGPPPS